MCYSCPRNVLQWLIYCFRVHEHEPNMYSFIFYLKRRLVWQKGTRTRNAIDIIEMNNFQECRNYIICTTQTTFTTLISSSSAHSEWMVTMFDFLIEVSVSILNNSRTIRFMKHPIAGWVLDMKKVRCREIDGISRHPQLCKNL